MSTNQDALYDISRVNVDISNEKFMTIGSTGSKSKAKYFYSDESVVTSPQKDVVMPDADVNFQLKDEILSVSSTSLFSTCSDAEPKVKEKSTYSGGKH